MKKRFNDSLRKRIVYLKRNTYIIPLIFILLSCLVFNLNLTCISDTTAIIYANGMGFTMFVISLFSYLSLITYMQAFPKRKKEKKFSIFLTFAMQFISLFLDAFYYYCIIYGTQIRKDPAPIIITEDKMYIIKAANTIIVHGIILIITIIVMSLLPIIKKFILKINTERIEIKYE